MRKFIIPMLLAALFIASVGIALAQCYEFSRSTFSGWTLHSGSSFAYDSGSDQVSTTGDSYLESAFVVPAGTYTLTYQDYASPWPDYGEANWHIGASTPITFIGNSAPHWSGWQARSINFSTSEDVKIFLELKVYYPGSVTAYVRNFQLSGCSTEDQTPDPGFINDCTPVSITSNILSSTIPLRNGIITDGLVTQAGDWFELEVQNPGETCIVRAHVSNSDVPDCQEPLLFDILDEADNLLISGFQTADDWWIESAEFVCDDVIKLEATSGKMMVNELEVCQTEGCSTVTNPHFANGYEGWTGTISTIQNSVATISTRSWTNPRNGETITTPGYVAQNVTLSPNVTYTAVISINRVISGLGNVVMGVQLGDSSQSVTLAGAGRYTATFAVADVAGPTLYKISNTTGGEFDVDYTCLIPPAENPWDPPTGECIAPTNGTFDTADNWSWYRGASWHQLGKQALLPFIEGADADRSLIVSTAAYTMPHLQEGEYLLLIFSANSQNEQAAMLSGLVGAVESFFEIYGGQYTYEADISATAGSTVTVAFANAGSEAGDFPATDNIFVDNVCLTVAGRPPELPIPTTPNTMIPFDFGFDYHCPDVPAILNAYGIDMYQAEAIFQDGVSVWDPVNYIPWLAAAGWHYVGSPVSCILVEFMRLVVGMTEQVINTITNIVNWQWRSANSTLVWSQQAGFYSTNSFYGWYRGWFGWFANSQRMMSQNWRILGSWLRWLPEEITDSMYAAFNVLFRLWNNNLLPYLQIQLDLTADSQLPDSETVYDLPYIGDGPFDWFSNFFGATDMIVALANLGWFAFDWFWNNVIGLITLPFEVYQAFKDGSSAAAFTSLIVCENQNFWCSLLAGMQMVNTATAHTIGYPMVIVGISIATIYIILRNMQKVVEIKFD